MSLTLQSTEMWSTVLERRTVTLIRPGAPLTIYSLALGQTLEPPSRNAKGTRIMRSVVHLSVRKLDREDATTVVIASLVPERTENFCCHISLFPGAEYRLEVLGNPVHVAGEFSGTVDSPTTEVRLLVKAPVHRSNRVASTPPVVESKANASGSTSGASSLKGPKLANSSASSSNTAKASGSKSSTTAAPLQPAPASQQPSPPRDSSDVPKRRRIWGL